MTCDFRVTSPVMPSLDETLCQIESTQLVRRMAQNETAYIIKHALVRDGASMSLTRHERKHLHRLVAKSLERVRGNRLDENAVLSAFHFERAEDLPSAPDEPAPSAAAHATEFCPPFLNPICAKDFTR